ncbi:hypothetical protein SAMN00017405_0909 [Desulfonispora thiosulfatigenes DSM 11270]|uniref:Uncharacterized protein n=1 Tax=Desulfonispora thiosulfatigenes DSM 11270 TaxID=656914 RepID=A0A1W1UMR7_DESTI|nr:hypothetical protein [Desulfonispora thiosulfatigenes]SMB82279.1 hypothetical protein SAMN00017405_0909 [Desulfonispora thiosulfatigenes DSM 11270]
MNIFLIIIGIILMGFTYRSIFIPSNINITSKKTINEKLDSLNDKIDYLQDKMGKEDNINGNKKMLSQELNFEDLVNTELSKDINEEIFKDYKQGLTVNELASKYKKGKGEIELRLNLKK